MYALLTSSVLVLNQDYSPLNVCNARRAINLIGNDKAETIIHSEHTVQTPQTSVTLPEVIRLQAYVTRPLERCKLSRKRVFARDLGQCQYCGDKTEALTIDHIVPRSRGGKHEWANVVSACRKCNYRKAGRTPKEAGMHLRIVPKEPPPSRYHRLAQEIINPKWQAFIPQYMATNGG